MLSTRIEKLKFIAEEMKIAFGITQHLTDPFVARSISRHVLIRAENFIEHARGLRKLLVAAGYDVRTFHKAKEAYADEFAEYFHIQRHRLSAHVQDFDFGKRIELWNDIEIVKVSYFSEGAREIYQILANLNIPDFVPYAEPSELSDPQVLEVLGQMQRALSGRDWVEVASDPLAMTRSNTMAGMNASAVHSRAGQLALIRRWIALQFDLYTKLAGHRRIAAILKARIVTDIVSFGDCLVTRNVPANAPQAMEGLDRLVVASGESSAPIDSFVAISNFQSDLQAARDVRDIIGAHVEIDAACQLSNVIASLESFGLADSLETHSRASAAFVKTCTSVFFLRMYAADGARVYGVTANSAVVPYSGAPALAAGYTSGAPPINDNEAYRKYLTQWLDGDEVQKGNARQFFCTAFQGSEVVEQIGETETIGAGESFSSHEFRKAHQFLLDSLMDLSFQDFIGVTELILSCRSGWPHPLAEILVRLGYVASPLALVQICFALGEIGSEPHASAHDFLVKQCCSSHEPIRLHASVALYKTFVHSEGLVRINNNGRQSRDYDALVDELLAPLSDTEQTVALLGFASVFTTPFLATFVKPFQEKYEAMQTRLEAICRQLLTVDDGSKASTLKELLGTHDYVGVCVLIAGEIADANPMRAALLDACCSGLIATAANDQAKRHLAMIFYLKKENRVAFEIADELAARNPDKPDVQILPAQLLGEMSGSESEARRRVCSIRRSYRLTPAQEAVLAEIEYEISKREKDG